MFYAPICTYIKHHIAGPVSSLLFVSLPLSAKSQSAVKPSSLQPFMKHLYHGDSSFRKKAADKGVEEMIPILLQGSNPVSIILV